MLAFTPLDNASRQRKCTPNLLPCRIHHSGPLKVHPRHWQPMASSCDSDDNNAVPGDTLTSYFRGRKLRGRRVGVPAGYKGELEALAHLYFSRGRR